MFMRRVMLVNEEFVREIEANASERISLAWGLENMDRSVAVVLNPQADPRQRHGVLSQGRQILVLHNGRRNVPGRVDGDELHLLADERRGHRGLSDYDFRLPDRNAVAHYLQ